MVSVISYRGLHSEVQKSKKFVVKRSNIVESHSPTFQRAERVKRMKKETSIPTNFIFCPADTRRLIAFLPAQEKPFIETGVQK